MGSWCITTECVQMGDKAAIVMTDIKNCLGLLLVCTATNDGLCDQGKRI